MISKLLDEIVATRLSPFDLFPQTDLREKIVELMLEGIPPGMAPGAKSGLGALRQQLLHADVDQVKVVVFGGGTGLSNIIGGDSRLEGWSDKPFEGLKRVFRSTRSVVCITDDGGSTGELLKDLPLVAVGDMRHVLLSSVKSIHLERRYGVDGEGAKKIVKVLSNLFNWRYKGPLERNHAELVEIESTLDRLPGELNTYFRGLLHHLFHDRRLRNTLQRSHCFGNLILTAAVFQELGESVTLRQLLDGSDKLHRAMEKGMNRLALVIGAGERAVMPCTSTPAQLKVVYTNGVTIRGEHKLENARRELPVERVEIDYCGEVGVYRSVLADISDADIIILAPGSLYSSIIPVFKVPGLADAVRSNVKALKILISNLWVQAGETDLSIVDPDRKFHVSDMIRAYEKNISGGTEGLFNEVLCISLKEIPASVLQSYAVEGKIPIYLDKEVLKEHRYIPIECGVYSREALAERSVIKHDPDTLALAVKGLYQFKKHCDRNGGQAGAPAESRTPAGKLNTGLMFPCQKYAQLENLLANLDIKGSAGDTRFSRSGLTGNIIDILWEHPIIPVEHFNNIAGIHCIGIEEWNRDQQWDNVFSFYDPEDRIVKIRADQAYIKKNLEIALMIAMGESLLGNYAARKLMHDVVVDGHQLGRTYFLFLRPEGERTCWFDRRQLHVFLELARMCATDDPCLYTRLVNRGDSFTPPGLLMGLVYAWYVDNRLATHIEYKMSVLKINRTDLIPAQLQMVKKRQEMIRFFTETVFNV